MEGIPVHEIVESTMQETPAKRALDDVIDDDDDDDDDFDDVKDTKKPRFEGEYDTHGNMKVNHDPAPQESDENVQADHDAAPQELDENMQTDHDAAPQELDENVQADHDAAPQELDENMQADHDAAPQELDENMQIDRDAAPQELDENMQADHDVAPEVSDPNDQVITNTVDQYGDVDGKLDTAESHDDQVNVESVVGDEQNDISMEDSMEPQNEVTSEHNGEAISDQALDDDTSYNAEVVEAEHTESTTGKASIHSVHQCVLDILADVQAIHPNIEFDEGIIGELNALSVSDALAVMQAFQSIVNHETAVGPLMQELISNQLASMSARKEEKNNRESAAKISQQTTQDPPTATSSQHTRASVPHSVAPEVPPPNISDAIWVRLLDSQHNPQSDFHLSQLRPSTLDALAALPDFAQLAIVARFTRAALPTVRSKDALLGQLMQEYDNDNPQFRNLEHVSQMIPDYIHDNGLFANGYAPPQPISGMLPDPPKRFYNVHAELKHHRDQFMLDEFGRVKTAPSRPSTQQQDRPNSTPASLLDEFRRSELYPKLPLPIRDVLESLYTKGHIKELLNDSVLSRLLKLPEHLAVRAVENFINTDASHVDNIHGFFVGIITRVYERDRGPPPPVAGVPGNVAHESSDLDRLNTPHQWSASPVHDQYIRVLSPTIQAQLQHMAATGVMQSVDEWGEKCYEILGQLSEGLAMEVLKRFTMANLESVRNRSGFLIGVVKRCRQEYGMM